MLFQSAFANAVCGHCIFPGSSGTPDAVQRVPSSLLLSVKASICSIECARSAPAYTHVPELHVCPHWDPGIGNDPLLVCPPSSYSL